MRFMVIIVSLTAIALGMIHLRRAELVARHQYQQLEDRRIQLRRKLWDQQDRLGYLVSPGEVRRRVDEMSLNLVDKDQAACAAPKSRPAVPPAAIPAHERKR